MFADIRGGLANLGVHVIPVAIKLVDGALRHHGPNRQATKRREMMRMAGGVCYHIGSDHDNPGAPTGMPWLHGRYCAVSRAIDAARSFQWSRALLSVHKEMIIRIFCLQLS